MDDVIGVVICFAGPFIPKNWLPCDGRQLPIASSYQVLFDVIGNAFGGDGKTTFNLPDLRGRTPVSPGASGVSKYKLGIPAGSETILLTGSQLPQHTHTGTVTVAMQGNTADGIDASSNLGFPGRFTGAYATTADCTMNRTQTNFVVLPPGNEPVNMCSPYLVLNYIICFSGIFPSKG